MDTSTVAKTLTIKSGENSGDGYLWDAAAVESTDGNNKNHINALETMDEGYEYKYYWCKFTSKTANVYDVADQAVSMNKDTYRTTQNTNVTPNKDEKNILIFKVGAHSSAPVTIERVWADLTLNNFNNKKVGEVIAKKINYKVSNSDKECYAIDLTDIEDSVFTDNMTMTIKAETKYEAESTDAGFSVHNIKFTGDVDTVEIRRGNLSDGNSTATNFDNSANKNVTDPITTKDATFDFTIRPKEGYAVSKGTNYNSGKSTTNNFVVEVSYDKVVRFTSNDTYYVRDTKRVEGEELSMGTTAKAGNLYSLASSLDLEKSITSADNMTLGDHLAKLAVSQNASASLNESTVSAVNAFTYSLKNIEINIKTTLTKDREGNVRVECPADMSYEVGGTGVEKDVNTQNQYRIGEDADLVVLKITSDVLPAVDYQSVDGTNDSTERYLPFPAKNITRDGNVYTVKIPVNKLELSASNNGLSGDKLVEWAGIKISRDKQILNVKEVYNDGAAKEASAIFTGNIKIEGAQDTPIEGLYTDKDINADGDVAIEDGRDITVTLTAKPGRVFDKVTYILGKEDEATPQDAAIGGEGTTATFSVRMTDKVAVSTETSRAYKYVITYGGSNDKAIDAGDGVYIIPANINNVKVRVFNGAKGQNVETVKIYDGNDTAASKATISTGGSTMDGNGDNDDNEKNTVTLTLSEKDGSLLRLEMKGKKNNNGRLIELPSISIRRDKAAEELRITDSDGNKVDSVTILPGKSTEEYKVEVVSGSLNFMSGNVRMEIARDASKQGGGTLDDDASEQVVEYDGIKATYNKKKGTLQIEGKEAPRGNDNPETLRFYNVAARDSGKGLGVVAGSEISVKLDSPAVAGITPEVSSFNTVYNVRLRLSTPGFAATKAENSQDIYYKVDIRENVDLPDGADDAAKARNVKENNEQKLDTPFTDGNKFKNGSKTVYIKKKAVESQEILLPINYQKKDNIPIKAEKTFNLTVTLVHQTEKSSVKEIWDDTSLTVSKAATHTAKTAKVSSQARLNLDTTSATIYTGQENQRIAKASFDEGSACELKTAVVDTKTGMVRSVDGLKVNTGLDGSIYVDASGVKKSAAELQKKHGKNLGLKVSSYGEETNEVFEVIGLKFVDGVGEIEFESGKRKVLYKQDGKAATMKLKAVINEKSGVKPKNKTLTYALVDKSGKGVGEADCSLSQNLRNNISVNPKNGTVTVGKNYVHDKSNCEFGVVAEASTGAKGYAFIEISQEAPAMGDVIIVDRNGNVVARDGGTLRKEDFHKELFVRVLKSSAVKTNNKFEVQDDFSKSYMKGVSVTSNAKKILAVSSTSGSLTMLASSKKAVKLTAVNTDGSKKTTKSITVNLTGPTRLGLSLGENGGGPALEAGKGLTYRYSGAMQKRFWVNPMLNVEGSRWEKVDDEYYKNIDVKVKGGKKEPVKGESWFSVLKTEPVTTITISDKTDKNVAPVTYTIEQDPATEIKGDKLSIKVPKLTEAMLESARSAKEKEDGTIKIKFQISTKEYAGMYVLLTPDYSKTRMVDNVPGTEEYHRADIYFLDGGSGQKAVKINENGVFEVELDMWRTSVQERMPGTYVLIATVGSYYSSGKFTPMKGVKSATVSIKIPGKAPKKMAAQTEANYTLSTGGEPVDLAGGAGISRTLKWDVDGMKENDNTTNLAKNKVSSDGSVNNFRKYFKVNYDGNGGYTLGMQTKNLKAADLDALLKDTSGKDLEGFVTLNVVGVGGEYVETRDVLLRVNLDQKATLQARKVEAYRGADATVEICGADGEGPYKLYGVAPDKSAGAPTGASVTLGAKGSDGAVKSVKVKIPSSATGTYEVPIRVLTEASAYANTTDKGSSATTWAERYGDSVKVQITVCDPATAANKLEVLTSGDDLAFKALHTKGEYTGEENVDRKWNSYYDTSTKKYVLRVDVKSRIDGAAIYSANYDKAFTDKAVKDIIAVSGSGSEILLTLDRARFLSESAKGGAIQGDAAVDIPVSVRFSLNGLKEETVPLTVKLPSPANFEQVRSSMLAAEAGLAGMKPDEYLEAGETSEKNLVDKLKNKFREAVPLDANVTVSPQFDPKENDDGDLEQRVVIQGAKADEKYERTFTWERPASTQWTADGLLDKIAEKLRTRADTTGVWLEKEINNLTHNKDAGVTVNNGYTTENFLRDITEILANYKIALGSNLSIVVRKVERDRATTGASGCFTYTIAVHDGKKNVDSEKNLPVSVRIPAVTNLGSEGTSVMAALNAMNYEVEIYKALDQSDIDGLEGKLADAIKKTAESALTDRNIEVELVDVSTDGFDNDKNGGTAGSKGKVAFKLPKNTADGELKYEINLKLAGVKPFVIGTTSATRGTGVTNAEASDELTLNAGTVGKTGRNFQTVEEAGTAISGHGSGTDAGSRMFAWSGDKATFKDQVEVGANENEKDRVESTVEERIGKLVTGMYLEVDARMNAGESGNKRTGTVTVSDARKKRAKTASAAGLAATGGYEWKGNFEIDLAGSLGTGEKESELGDAEVMPESVFNTDDLITKYTGAPTYDRVSGINLGKKKLVKRTSGMVEYRYDVTGTLKYVDRWSAFGDGDTGKGQGYFTMIRIPVPAKLKSRMNTNNTKYFIESVGCNVARYAYSDLSGDYLNLCMRIDQTNRVVVENAGDTGSNVKGFRVIVDYNSLNTSTESGGDRTLANITKSDGNVTGDDGEYALTTYTFDMSGVALDNSSPAIVKLVPNVFTEYSTDSALLTWLRTEIELTESNVGCLDVKGSNGDGNRAVVKASGTLTSTHLKTYPTDNRYYVAVSIKAPEYVAPRDSSSGNELKTGAAVSATARVWNHSSGGYKDAGTEGRFGNAIQIGGTGRYKMDEALLILAVNDADMENGNTDVAIAVDWDGPTGGSGGDRWGETIYTLDLSDVVYRQAQ